MAVFGEFNIIFEISRRIFYHRNVGFQTTSSFQLKVLKLPARKHQIGILRAIIFWVSENNGCDFDDFW